MGQEHTLRILHVSDLHARGAMDWRRRQVLGEEWERNLDALLADGPFDLLCMTGDLAFSGQADEYAEVTGFVDAMLQRLGVPRERLFVVPGNHDVDRGVEKNAWRRLRKLMTYDEARAFSAWLAGGKPPRGVRRALRDAVLLRQAAHRDWLTALGREDLLPARSPHGRLGYRATLRLPGHSFDIHVIGLDSAWLAGEDGDARDLWLTEDQVMRLVTDDSGALSGFRLALIHHPLTDLADGEPCRRLLAGSGGGTRPRVDLLLRGHLHETELEAWADPDRTLRQLAAGCLYEHHHYPNACVALTLTLDSAGRPLRGHVRLRAWSGKRFFWHDDNSLYRDTRDGHLDWFTPPPRSHPAPRPRVFVGRETELAELAHLIDKGPVAVCAVQGMPGVGKSHLVDHFAGLHATAFPGGYLRLVLDPGDTRTAEALRDILRDQLALTAPTPDPWQLLAERLRAPRTLVHVENADSAELAATVARLAQHLPGCALVITGRYRELGREARWPRIEVAPFDERAGLGQLEAELGPARDQAERDARRSLVQALAGLPLALHLAAGYLAAGHTVERFLEKLRRTRLGLRPRDPADPVLDQGARAILRSTFDISLEHLRSTLARHGDPAAQMAGLAALGHAPAAGVGQSLGAAMSGLAPGDYEDLVVEARSLSLLDPVSDRPGAARMHSLLAEHVRADAPHDVVVTRMTAWFVERLLRHEHDQGRRWGEIHAEHAALTAWLAAVPPADLARVERAGKDYAELCGPYLAWVEFCERCLQAAKDDDRDRSNALWTLGLVARRSGNLDRALAAARDKAVIDQACGDERGAALALSQIADILQERGELDEALRIRREEELPVFERLGDVRERAVTLGRIADILQERGELDEALRIRREEELPVYERFGDVHARAVTLGQIADIFQARGELEEALRIRREEVLPVFERLGVRRELVVGRTNLALLYLRRQAAGDRECAAELLRQALADARAMRIHEAGTIEAFMRRHGIDP